MTGTYRLTELPLPDGSGACAFSAIVTRLGLPILRVFSADDGSYIYRPLPDAPDDPTAVAQFREALADLEVYSRAWAGQRWAPTVAECDGLVT